MSLYQMYVLVPETKWELLLKNQWPYSPIVSKYRLIVMTNKELPTFELEYVELNIKRLEALEVISEMESDSSDSFICNLDDARLVVKHFTSLEE